LGASLERFEGHPLKYFILTFLNLVFLQILDHIPEKVVFAKLIFDSDLEFFRICFTHP
jgi:hypothetical protein